MPNIRLYNSKTRRKEDFTPLDPKNVRMYLCGPTVYDRAHLGNARNVILFDVLFRLLRHTYGPDHVTYVRNFTDVDDKINAEALLRRAAGAKGTLEQLIAERSDETIGWYHADMDALGALRPTHEPRATDYIPQMIAMIETLVAGGHAYAKQGHVLFRVRSYADYGQLSGRTVDDMIAGARVEVAPFKEDPMDFVLWKPSSEDEPGWDSPWGRGRPGWHIECSAMADELLMKDLPEDRKAFDIHGGGLDLQFPHHENELAQSTCAHPKGGFANIWLHNEMLLVEGKKMSKSLGNFFTVRDLLDQGVPGGVIRLVFLQTHYRKPMDWTEEKRVEAEEIINRWTSMVYRVKPTEKPCEKVIAALSDDLNTSAAVAALHALATERNFSCLAASCEFLGIDIVTPHAVEGLSPATNSLVIELLDIRKKARKNRRFDVADNIRSAFKAAGIRVVDGADGAEWWQVKDELDASVYFDAVRSAHAIGSQTDVTTALLMAKNAGVHFAADMPLDVAPAWRGLPTDEHVFAVLKEALVKIKDLT